MNIWTFLTASVLLTLTPGPDILFVITQSVTRGVKSGVIFALGLSSGLIFHLAAVVLGISVVLKQSPVAFAVLKIVGACYLIYLGITSLVHRRKTRFKTEGFDKEAAGKLYLKGISMNIVNPKVILFFSAFFPGFIDAEAGNPTGRILILGLIFIAQTVVIFPVVAFFSARLSAGVMQNPKFSVAMNIVSSLIFFTIGISVLFV